MLLAHNYAVLDSAGMDVERSTMDITGTMMFTNNSAGVVGGGITILDDSYVNITGSVLLTDNHAGVQGGGMDVESSLMDILGTVMITNNSAGVSGGGIVTTGSNINIAGSVSLTDNYAGNQGGGMAVDSGIMTIAGTVSLTNNAAGTTGGGIGMLASNVSIAGNVLLADNYAGYQGGGMHLQDSGMKITGTVLLTNNAAGSNGHGGGINMYGSSVAITGNVSLTDNYAGIQGGGMEVYGSNIVNVTGTVSLTNNSAGSTGGGIYLYVDNIMNITGNVSLTNNCAGIAGGGMAVQGSSLDITGTVSLTSNSAGSIGGGIFMYGSEMAIVGRVLLTDNCASVDGGGMSLEHVELDIAGKVYFTENYAHRGGAIIVHDVSKLVYCASDVGAECVIEDCFFQISENVSLNRDSLLVFKDNVAESGSVLYGGSVDRCRLEGHPEAHSGEVFDMIANYTEQPATLSVISSDPFRVCLCEDSQPHCSDTQTITVTAYPGQAFLITAAAVGQRNGTVTATVSSNIKPPETSRLAAFEERQNVPARCAELHYTIFSSHSNNQLIMYVDPSCSSLDDSVDLLSISVHLVPCPPAFTLSESTYGCDCEERLQKYTNKCNINDQSILRDGDFWVGYDNQSRGLILHPHCPFDYCQTKLTYFTLSETDLQCEFNRTGLLCGACHPDLSLALGSSQCLPCSDIYLSLLVPFAVMGFVLVFFLHACKLTVTIGTINALVFYANVVGANQSLFFPPRSANYLTVFIAWLNLDLGIETCFYDGMDTYVKTWLQFAFPIYIWAIVGLVIFISGRSRRISRMLGSNPVAVLSTLFLLSYAKILRTIIAALSFSTLQYPNEETQVVWLYDANIRYLHGKHIPLFVVGLLVFAFLFLPYTLLLLLGQWLQHWMNNQKLKAFLDAYYAPHKENHRYWTGLLLIVRFVLLLAFDSNALGDNSENLLAISAASFGLLVWMIGNVYRNRYLDALEASFILNLGVLAIATHYVQRADAGGNQGTVTYTSTSIAFATFIGIVLYHIYLQTKESRFWRVICCRKNDRQPDSEWNGPEDSGDRPVVAPTTTYVSFGSCVQLHEPLLDAQ